jgi:hypothetical protein
VGPAHHSRPDFFGHLHIRRGYVIQRGENFLQLMGRYCLRPCRDHNWSSGLDHRRFQAKGFRSATEEKEPFSRLAKGTASLLAKGFGDRPPPSCPYFLIYFRRPVIKAARTAETREMRAVIPRDMIPRDETYPVTTGCSCNVVRFANRVTFRLSLPITREAAGGRRAASDIGF